MLEPMTINFDQLDEKQIVYTMNRNIRSMELEDNDEVNEENIFAAKRGKASRGKEKYRKNNNNKTSKVGCIINH